MSKTITISTKVKLKEYRQELEKRESQERKDKCVLLTLAIAGLLGVYVLVVNSVENRRAADRTPVSLEDGHAVSADRPSAVSSMN